MQFSWRVCQIYALDVFQEISIDGLFDKQIWRYAVVFVKQDLSTIIKTADKFDKSGVIV